MLIIQAEQQQDLMVQKTHSKRRQAGVKEPREEEEEAQLIFTLKHLSSDGEPRTETQPLQQPQPEKPQDSCRTTITMTALGVNQ